MEEIGEEEFSLMNFPNYCKNSSFETDNNISEIQKFQEDSIIEMPSFLSNSNLRLCLGLLGS